MHASRSKGAIRVDDKCSSRSLVQVHRRYAGRACSALCMCLFPAYGSVPVPAFGRQATKRLWHVTLPVALPPPSTLFILGSGAALGPQRLPLNASAVPSHGVVPLPGEPALPPGILLASATGHGSAPG